MAVKTKKVKRRVRVRQTASELKKEIAEQMLKLATSAFGLVAALAWNELIKTFVSSYVEPFFGGSSDLISLGIYAIIVTVLAVFVTYNLSHFVKKESK